MGKTRMEIGDVGDGRTPLPSRFFLPLLLPNTSAEESHTAALHAKWRKWESRTPTELGVGATSRCGETGATKATADDSSSG